MNILITGITGRIGSNVASFLIKAGHNVTGFSWSQDQKIEKMKKIGCKIIVGDLENFDDVNRAVSENEVVLHMGAAFQSGGPFSPNQYFDINVKGTFNILEACSKNSNIKHLIVTSTDSTISKYPEKKLTSSIGEFDLPQDTTEWYGYSKILTENLSRRYYISESLPVTILRFSMVFGRFEVCGWNQFYTGHHAEALKNSDNPDKEKVVLELNQQIAKGNQLIIPTSEGISWKKHVIDIRDIVHAYDAMICNEKTFGSTYQIAGPNSFNWSDVIPKLSENLNLGYCTVEIPTTPTFYEFDLTASINDFGYSPKWDLISMIEDELKFNDQDFGDVIPAEADFRRGYQI